MAQFVFQSKSIDGKEQRGVREAEDQVQLAHMLRQEGYILISASPAKESKRKFNISLPALGVDLKEKIFFCKNLQVISSSGLSLPRAVGILSEQTTNRTFHLALEQIKDDVIKGEAFSNTLAKYPKIFSEFLRSMIKVGEETGTMDHVLGIAVSQMEKEYTLKSKIKGALIYPAVIIIAMIGVGILMLTTVVPQLAATFKDLNVSLPASTQFIIALGDFMQNYWWLAIGGTAVFIAILARLMKTKYGKKIVDDVSLKFPAISLIVRNVNSAYTLRNLSALVGAGVSLPRALEITAGTVGNYKYRNALMDIEERVKKGEKFSAAIANYKKIYPVTAIQMVAVGEETGETSNILLKLAEFYENEVDEETKSFAAIIEPMLMIVIGVVVGFFAVSMVQPMYSMMDAI
jgi:type IV pilus assembly protein PilC